MKNHTGAVLHYAKISNFNRKLNENKREIISLNCNLISIIITFLILLNLPESIQSNNLKQQQQQQQLKQQNSISSLSLTSSSSSSSSSNSGSSNSNSNGNVNDNNNDNSSKNSISKLGVINNNVINENNNNNNNNGSMSSKMIAMTSTSTITTASITTTQTTKSTTISNDIVAQFSLPSLPLISTSGNTITSTISSNNNGNINTTASSSIFPSNNNLNSTLTNYFTHLAYDKKRNVFYAGATNKILNLNENLRVLSQSLTGPKQDSPQCHAGGCPDDIETILINNHNKILIINYSNDNDILIACGSIRQGSCEIYNLSRFPNSPKFISIPLAANDEFSSTYAFIGPSQYQNWHREDILYVGTTFTNYGDYRHDVPAISSRKLDDLNYAEFSIQQSIINIDVKYRDHFLVDYIYGFNSSEYAYFAIVQKKSHLAEEAGYITRLARICITDSNYDSYTEITIQCQLNDIKNGEIIDYNILRDAKITQAGQKLAQQLGIKRDDHVLVTIFSPSKEITNQPEPKSAMCIYSLKEIEEVFIENIHMCFNGTIKDRNLGYISGTINDGRCPLVGSLGNIYSFCAVGLKISGVSPITSRALFHFDNISITSVTATTTGPHSLAFLGTETGTIKKVLISGQSPGEYEEVVVDPGNRILQDTMMSPKRLFICTF